MLDYILWIGAIKVILLYSSSSIKEKEEKKKKKKKIIQRLSESQWPNCLSNKL